MAPSPFRIKPLNARLRNVILSSGLCVALITAYYMAIGNETVPPDTHIQFTEAVSHHQIDIAADGTATISVPGAADQLRHLTKPQIRHVLRAFRHQNFLELDVAKFRLNPGEYACSLALTLDHRKTAIFYGCQHPPVEVAAPLKALAHEIQAARS